MAEVFKGEIDYTMGMYDVSTTVLNMFGIYNKYSVGSDIFNSKKMYTPMCISVQIPVNKFKLANRC